MLVIPLINRRISSGGDVTSRITVFVELEPAPAENLHLRFDFEGLSDK